METKKMTKGFRKMLWLMWLLAVVILIAVAYILPGISGTLKQTYLAEYDTVRVADTVNCYLVRDEVITYAENSGAISYYYEEGTKVRRYTTIMKVGSKPYIEPSAGTISYYSDGLESYFDPQKLSSVKRSEVENMNSTVENLVAETAVTDQPLYKTIRGNTWNIIFWADKESMVKYNKGNSVSVILGDTKISATISEIIHQVDEYMVVLETNQYYRDYTSVREIEAEIVTMEEQGLRLNAQSLVSIDGQAGVYVKELNGEYTFTPVKIYTLSGEDVLVARDSYTENTANGAQRVDTVSIYDEILTNGASIPTPAAEETEENE